MRKSQNFAAESLYSLNLSNITKPWLKIPSHKKAKKDAFLFRWYLDLLSSATGEEDLTMVVRQGMYAFLEVTDNFCI